MRVIVHPGMPKTGSTTLQAILHASRERLRANGVCYPTVHPPTMPAHHGLVADIAEQLGVPIQLPVDEHLSIEDAFAQARAAECQTLLLSTEELAGRRITKEIWDELVRRLRANGAGSIQLVISLRELSSAALSLYKQMVARHHETWALGTPDDALDILLASAPCDPERFIERFVGTLVPPSDIAFAITPRQRDGALLWERFAAAAELDIPATSMEFPAEDANVSRSDRALAALQRINAQTPPPHTIGEADQRAAAYANRELIHRILLEPAADFEGDATLFAFSDESRRAIERKQDAVRRFLQSHRVAGDVAELRVPEKRSDRQAIDPLAARDDAIRLLATSFQTAQRDFFEQLQRSVDYERGLLDRIAYLERRRPFKRVARWLRRKG